MRVPGLLSGALLCALALGALPAAAAPPLCSQVTPAENVADPGLNLLTETSHTGVVDVYFQPSIGTPVTFYECVHERAYPLGTAQSSGQLTGIAGAVPWLCGRRRRDFRATTTHEGRFVRRAASALTPTCAHRFTLTAPRRVRRGRTAAVLVSDTWGTGGIHTRLCITSPSGDRRCRRVAFAPSVSTRSVRFRAGRRGLYELELQVRRFHVRAAVAAGVKPVAVKARPVLLATGDSTMNGVAGALGDDLGEFDVAGRVYPGAELSDVAWPKLARDQVADLHPAVTVVSIGATEGFPMTSPDGVTSDCCGPAWVAEYTRRARAMMRTYRQGGRARVYFETIPLSRDPARAAIVRLCNQAFVEAARGLAGVSVLRMDLLFSPHGYQETIRDGGRDVRVREDDGVHLNASGTAIEARETARAIRGREVSSAGWRPQAPS